MSFSLNLLRLPRNIERVPSPLVLVLTTILAFLLGGMPFGYWLVRLSSGRDIRTMGSGNIGATNVHRTAGRKAGFAVLSLDILKGFVAVWLAGIISDHNPWAIALSAVAVILGHCYPVLLGFRGGKAVACFVGAFLYAAPLALGITTLLFVAIVWFTRYISLGSILCAALFPFLFWYLYLPSDPLLWASFVASAVIVYRHHANIARLLKGQEHVFSLKGGRAA